MHTRGADRSSDFIDHFGRGRPWNVTIPVFAGHGILCGNKRRISVGLQLAAGNLIANETTRILKTAFGRRRPYETDSPFEFFENGSAFYSGNTVSVFTMATILSKNFPRQDLGLIGIHGDVPVIPVLSFSIGGFVGLQRLYSNNHWASDVFFGALAGYPMGCTVVHLGKKVSLGSLFIVPGQSWSLLWGLHID